MAWNYGPSGYHYLTLGISVPSTQKFTMAGFYNPDDLPSSTRAFMAIGDESTAEFIGLGTFGSNSKVSSVSYTPGTGSITLSTGTTYHLAVSWDGSTDFSVYVDGVLDYSVTETGITWNVFDRFSIGGTRRNGGLGNSADGQVQSVGLWSDALTLGEIKSLANGSMPRNVRPSALVHDVPLIRDVTDYISKSTITTGGAPTRVEQIAPTIYGGAQILHFPISGDAPPVGGLDIPIASYHYQHNVGSNL